MAPPDLERRSNGRLSDREVGRLRAFVASISETEVQLLHQLLLREQALTAARAERAQYKKLCIEGAIKWSIPIVLTAALGVLLWTGKLWLLALLSALHDASG